MKNLVTIVLVLSFHVLNLGQEITLPIVKNGNWFLLKNGKEIQLPAKYTFVNFFDTQGFSYFQVGQNYGIIDEKGNEIVVAKYKDISAFGNAYFSCQVDSGYEFIQINSLDFKPILCKNTEKLAKDWVYLDKKNDKGFLFNLNNDLVIPQDTTLHYEISFNHLILYKDSLTSIIYNSLGENIFSGKIDIKIDYAFTSMIAENFSYVIDDYGFWHFPKNSKHISIDNEYIHYQKDKLAYLLNRLTKKEIISFPCDKIRALKNNYEISKNDLIGIISKEKKVLIEAKFDFIEFSDKFIFTHFNTLKGIYDYNFKEIVPCKYKTIEYDQSFFYTKGVNVYCGLYSRLTNKEILPAVYDKIDIKNFVIKAKYNGILTLVELDKNHKILNKIALGQTYSVKTLSHKNPNSNFTYDPRLLDIGWYFDSVHGKKNEIKWGIKTADDSIVLSPKYKRVEFVQNAPFSIVVEDFTKNESLGFKGKYGGDFLKNYSLVSYTNGRKLKLNPLFHIDTLDFLSKNFTRFVDSASSGIITRDNKIRRMSFVDLGEAEFIRYCNTSKYDIKLIDLKAETCIPFPTWNKYYRITNIGNRGLEYQRSTWNFLDKNGDSLFKESFDFAQNFFRKTAIVMKNNLWGIVNQDSILIPIKYNSVKRLKEYQDSAFLISTKQNKALFLDSNLITKSDFKLQFDSKHGNIVVFKQQNKFILYHINGTKILETEKTPKFHHFNRFNRFVIKEKKAYLIYDENGKVLAEVKSKPDSFLNEEAFIVDNSGKKGLISMEDDTLIPIKYNEINAYNKYILAQNTHENSIYTDDYHLIKSLENKTILIDSLSNFWAVKEDAKISVYNSENKMIAKFKTNEVEYDYFYNKLFFSLKSKSIVDISGQKVDLKILFQDIKAFEYGYFALLNEDKLWTIYSEKLEKIADEIPEIRKITYLGDQLFGLKTKKGFVIYDALSSKNYCNYKNAIPNWNEGLLLVEKNTGKFPFEFLNREFENPFHRSFKNATIFSNGFASISDERGWTIIDKNGFQKSYPNFNKIDNLTKNIFLSHEKALYGIYDQNGKEIIEVKFEKLNFINEKIIQGIKEGEIYYFDYQGKPIYNTIN